MRVKLCLDSAPQIGQRHKICFFVDKESCKKVVDLSYLIQKRFFSSAGNLALFLDGFFIPPRESIDIIQENDVLTIKFEQNTKSAGHKKKGNSNQGIGKTDANTTSTSSSEEETSEEEVPAKKAKKTAPSSAGKNKLVNISKGSLNNKKVIPLSKLGISKQSVNKDSSNSSSSDSESSTDENTNNRNKKSIAKKPSQQTKNKTNKVVRKKQVVNVESSSSESSSSSSESDDDDDDDDDSVDINKTEQSCNVDKSKVDFHVSGLSQNATSTPGVNKFGNNSNDKSSLKRKTPNSETSIGKRIAEKDRYKNVSKVFTYSPNDSKSKNNFAVPKPVPMDTSLETKLRELSQSKNNDNLISTSLPTQSKWLNSQDISSPRLAANKVSFGSDSDMNVSGRTLRNRRRRQKKMEQQRQQREESKLDKSKMENGEVKSTLSALEAAAKVVEKTKTLQEISPQINGSKHLDEKNNNKTESGLNEVLTKNYLGCAEIKECPPPRSLIAFKVFDLDDNYQPFVSDYKEGEVLSYDKSEGLVELKLSNGFTLNDKRGGKFEMPKEEREGEEKPEVKENSNDVLSKEWTSLVEPRLIKNSKGFEF